MMSRSKVFVTISLVPVIIMLAGIIFCQGINSTGNGGKHTIQGRIYDPSGQRADLSNLKVTLESGANGDMTVFASLNGTFAFKNLIPGSYTISMEGSDSFEPFRETVFIDDPGTSSISSGVRLSSSPRTVNVQVYLQPKRVVYNGPKPGVVDARLSGVSSEARDHYLKAQALNSQGRISAAITELEQAVAIDKKFTLAYNDLGLLYTKLPNIDKALSAFTSAVASNPEDFESNLNFGVANYYTNKDAAAEKALHKAASIDTTAVTPHYYLARLFIQKKELETARTELETARTLMGDKPFPIVHRLLGGIYMEFKMKKEAAAELEKYIALAPDAQDASRIKQTINDLKKNNE